MCVYWTNKHAYISSSTNDQKLYSIWNEERKYLFNGKRKSHRFKNVNWFTFCLLVHFHFSSYMFYIILSFSVCLWFFVSAFTIDAKKLIKKKRSVSLLVDGFEFESEWKGRNKNFNLIKWKSCRWPPKYVVFPNDCVICCGIFFSSLAAHYRRLSIVQIYARCWSEVFRFIFLFDGMHYFSNFFSVCVFFGFVSRSVSIKVQAERWWLQICAWIKRLHHQW